MTIRPTAFTLEHIPKALSPTGSITSAPKDFAVYVSAPEARDPASAPGSRPREPRDPASAPGSCPREPRDPASAPGSLPREPREGWDLSMLPVSPLVASPLPADVDGDVPRRLQGRGLREDAPLMAQLGEDVRVPAPRMPPSTLAFPTTAAAEGLPRCAAGRLCLRCRAQAPVGN